MGCKKGEHTVSVEDKIKHCGQVLQQWDKHNFGNVTRRIRELNEDISKWRKGYVTEDKRRVIKRKKAELEECLEREELVWKQRVRRLKVEGGRVLSKEVDIQGAILEYFCSIFQSTNPTTSKMDEVLASVEARVTDQMNEELRRPFTPEEVHATITQMHPFKSPGPDADFEEASGLKINLAKSAVVFSKNVPHPRRVELANQLGVVLKDKHDKYFGLPSIVGQSKKEVFSCVKDRVWQHIQNWTSKQLSQAGRTVFIKSIIQSIPTYIMSCFQIPYGLLKDIEGMEADFFWHQGKDRKIHWLVWGKLCKNKKEGGLGFRRLKAFNFALLANSVES
ncbi:UNVERIFIED_CONTAM: hypothetical protein Slati_1324200 [Sesamum latifolium]|uniref:Reverse transcriptase n=1 Tax=Sesamum latifolium TaxID=2727402 RepID=A0AAW2XML5_9LAMI